MADTMPTEAPPTDADLLQAVNETVEPHAELLPLDDVDHNGWLTMRTKGIGGSDAGPILGASRYSSPLTVWANKTGRLPDKDLSNVEAVYWGNVLEHIVCNEFAKRTGFHVIEPTAMYRSREYPWMLANPDRFYINPDTGDIGILEAKTGSQYLLDDWAGRKIPLHYELQALHYCAVLGITHTQLAALIGGQTFVIREVEVNPAAIDVLIETERAFWHDHVLPDIQPPVDGSDATTETLDEMYQQLQDSTPVGPEGLAAAIAYDEAREAEKVAKEAKALAANQLRALIKDAAIATHNGETIFTYKEKAGQVSWKNLATALATETGHTLTEADIDPFRGNKKRVLHVPTPRTP